MNNEINLLLDKYLNGEATESEKNLVEAWYASFESGPGLTDQVSKEELASAMKASFALLSQKLDANKKAIKRRVV